MIINKGTNIGMTLQLIKSDGRSVEENAVVTYRIFDSTGLIELVSIQVALYNSITKSYIDSLIPNDSWLTQDVGSYFIIWSISNTKDNFNDIYIEDLQIIIDNDIIKLIEEKVEFLKNIEGGRWKITNNQMIFYKEDNITEIAKFDLFDSVGYPTVVNVYERVRKI